MAEQKETAVNSETGPDEASRYGESGGEAASMEKAAERTQGPGTAQAPARTVVKSEAGEPTPEQAPRETHGPADHRPSQV